MSRKTVIVFSIFILMCTLTYLGLVSIAKWRKPLSFKCNAELFIENARRGELLDATFSIILMRGNTAMIAVAGNIKKENLVYEFNKRIYFSYIDNQLEGFLYFQKKREEGTVSANSEGDEIFNRLMFSDKKAFYLAITHLGKGAYEVRDTLIPLLVCYKK